MSSDVVRSTHSVSIGAGSVVKTYERPVRGEPQREWSALRLLEKYAPGLAPSPIDLSGPPWVLRMSRLPGHPHPSDEPLTAGQLQLLGQAFECLWSAVPASSVAALPERILGPSHVRDVLRDRLASVATACDPICVQALAEFREWLDGSASPLFGRCPDVVLGRGDPNLDNVLWHPSGAHLVDFEDSGQSCRAYELAELAEHLGSRATPDESWLEFASVHLDSCIETYSAARRAFAGFWLLLLLPGGPAHDRNPAGSDVVQARRLQALLACD